MSSDSTIRLRSDLRWVLPPEGGVLLLGDGVSRWIDGSEIRAMVPLIDGSRTEDEVVDAVAGVDRARAYYALQRLEGLGLLIRGSATGPFAAWFEAAGTDPGDAAARRSAARICLRACGAIDLAPFAAALAAVGLTAGTVDATAELVVTADLLHGDPDGEGRRIRANGLPALLVCPVGRPLTVGPWLGTDDGPCWSCLAHRVRGNRAVEGWLARSPDLTTGGPGLPLVPPDGGRALAALAASMVLSRLVGGGGGGAAEVLELDPATGRTTAHRVHRRPQCAICGDPGLQARRQGKPVGLGQDGPVVATDGGWRTAEPAQTVARFEDQVSPLTGVVERLAEVVPAGVAPGSVALVDGGRSRSRPWTSLTALQQGFRHLSFGKGRTVVQARASALCEALERYSGVYQGDEDRAWATIDELGAEVVPPQALWNYSPAQFANRNAWNRRYPQRSHQVPQPFDPARSIPWTRAWPLGGGPGRYVPSHFVFYDEPAQADHRFGFADSNGASAGNTVAEAVLQGLLELIERDAAAMWWYPRCQRPAVDLGSFDDPWIRESQAVYARLGRQLWVLDLTHDLGVPVFAAVSASADGGAPSMGLGAHLDPRIALGRAVSELHQMLPYTQALAAGTLAPGTDVHDWLTGASLDRDPYLTPSQAPLRTANHWPTVVPGDLAERCDDLVQRLEALGLEAMVVDLTRPDVGLTVVKVIVPGLRHFWPRFGPGRLYDVPVALDWTDGPVSEAALNPVPVFF